MSRSVTAAQSRISHSQIVSTSQPALRNAPATRRSRAWFARSFGAQKPRRDFGRRPSAQRCRCQKQPCTKIAFRSPTKAMSGLPGTPPGCVRYPRRNWRTSRRTASSGPVSRARMSRMRALRCSGVRVSMFSNDRLARSRAWPASPCWLRKGRSGSHGRRARRCSVAVCRLALEVKQNQQLLVPR